MKKIKNKKTIRFWLFCVIIFSATTAYSQDPFTELAAVINPNNIAKTDSMPQVTVGESYSGTTTNRKTAILFKKLPMVDSTGKTLRADSIVKIPNGKTTTIGALFDFLNNVEQNYLNPRGFTFWDNKSPTKFQLITQASPELLSSQKSKVPALLNTNYLEYNKRKDFSNTTQTVNSGTTSAYNMVPLSLITDATILNNQQLSNFAVSSSGLINKIGNLDKLCLGPLATGTIDYVPRKKISDTTQWNNTFGDDKLGLNFYAMLARNATFFKFDPTKPASNQSQERITAKANLTGYILSAQAKLIEALADFTAPANTSLNMTALIDLKVCGFSIYSTNSSYPQKTTLFKKTYGQSADFSKSFVYPIIGIINAYGKIGVKGNIGISLEATLDRTMLSADAEPIASLSGYLEVGLDAIVARAGIGCNVIFAQISFPMNAYFGLYNSNACQTTFTYGYYVGITTNFLSGNMYFTTDVYGCDICTTWGIPYPCNWGWKNVYRYDFANWTGFLQRGTIAQNKTNIVLTY